MPGTPEQASIGRTRAGERVKIAAWMTRWADVRLRDANASAPDKYAANIIKRMAKHIGNATRGELTDINDNTYRHQGQTARVREWRKERKAKGLRYR